MSKKVKILESESEKLVIVHCPGCNIGHPFRVDGDRPRWEWNGDEEKPTFHPSMLVNQSIPESRCHSWVRDGQIQFLGDCWHDMANETHELPDLDEHGDPK